MFQLFSCNHKSVFLKSLPKKLLEFICECIVSLLKGNLQNLRRHRVSNFPSEVRLLSLKQTNWKEKKRSSSQKRMPVYQNSFFPHVVNHLRSFEPFVLVSASWTPRASMPRQLPSRSFQSIKLNKVPRTEMIRWKSKLTKNCLPKQAP